MTCKKCGGEIHGDACKLCEMFAEQAPPGGTCTGWPMKSMSMGVLPSQVQEANEHLAANGIRPSEAVYEPDGRVTIHSAKAKKKVMKAKGMTDFSAFN